MIKIGSLFAGIGGFELGLERAIPGSKTVWQVEQEPFCQKILRKHWPHANIYDDVQAVGAHNLEQVDIICGGFPCQDISTAGLGRGLEGEKSSLWFEMLRVICELRPKVAVMENVPAITVRGLPRILGGLSQIGYDVEWQIISARQFGAPHIRKRWFAVAYQSSLPDIRRGSSNTNNESRAEDTIQSRRQLSSQKSSNGRGGGGNIANSDSTRFKSYSQSKFLEKKFRSKCGGRKISWNELPRWTNKDAPKPVICRVDDGVSHWMDRSKRLKALGNSIVPQCSHHIGEYIFNSGLLS